MQRGRFILILGALLLTLTTGSMFILIWKSVTPYKPDYEIIYIEDMPCLVIDSGYGKGITCNWDKWSGR